MSSELDLHALDCLGEIRDELRGIRRLLESGTYKPASGSPPPAKAAYNDPLPRWKVDAFLAEILPKHLLGVAAVAEIRTCLSRLDPAWELKDGLPPSSP